MNNNTNSELTNNEEDSAAKRKHEESSDSDESSTIPAPKEDTSPSTETKEEANSHQPDPKGNSSILQIVEDMENLKNQETLLSGQFEEWCSQRKRTIEILEIALTRLENASKSADWARFIVLALKCIWSLYDFFTETEVPRPQARQESKKHKTSHSANSSEEKENNWLKFASDVSIPVIALMESGFNKYFLSDVRDALEKDRELTGPINKWIRSTQDLEQRVVQTFGVSLISTPIEKVISSINRTAEMLHLEQKDAALQEIQSIHGSKALDVFSELTSQCDLKQLSRILNKAATALKDAPGQEEIGTKGLKLGVAFNPSDVISVVDIFSGMFNFDEHNRSGVVRIVKDVAYTAKVVQRFVGDGQTQHSKSVEEVLDKLKKQLKEVTNVFNPKD